MRDLIMDIGMHDGHDTQYYLSLGFRVVSVEANPMRVEAARHLFATWIASGRLAIEAVALAADDGEGVLYVNPEHDELSSLHLGCAARDGVICEAIPVVCRNPRFLFESYGVPYYLKIDIEGEDRCVLDALRGLPLPRFLSIEMTDANDIRAVYKLGYRDFKLVDHRVLDAAGNTSGPFGENVPGEWIDSWDVANEYARTLQRYATSPVQAWCDLHARAPA